MLMELFDGETHLHFQVDVLGIDLSNGDIVDVRFDLTSLNGLVIDCVEKLYNDS